MNKIYKSVVLLFATLFCFSFALGQADSVGAGFHSVTRIMENPDVNNSDRVPQLVVGGLDLNENGKKEFLYITDNTFTGGRQSFYLGYSLFLYEYDNATTSYKNIWQWSLKDTVGGSFPVFTIADLDGDTHKEIVLGVQYAADLPVKGANPDRLLVFEFGTTLPTDPTATWNFDAPAGSNTRPSAIASGDVDGDSKQELGIAFRTFNGTSRGMMIVSLNGDFAGALTQWTKEMYDTTTSTGSIFGAARVTDLDNDGKKEISFGHSGVARVYVYEATAANTYSKNVINLAKGTSLTSGNTFAMMQADINKDGKNELIFGAQGPVELYAVQNITQLQSADSSQDVKRIAKVTNIPKSGINEIRGLTVGDIDGNGKTDIFTCNGSRIWRFEYKGTGLITDSSSYTTSIVYSDTNTSSRYRWVTFTGDDWSKSMGISGGDMDGDGKAELILANQRGGSPDQFASKIVLIESDVVTSVEINDKGQVVATYKLEQNYPNPFNPTTKINYSISSAQQVKLEVYDITGRLVTTLVNGVMSAGEHTVSFNASGLASGTYIYSLTSGSNSISKKMVLMK